MAGSEIARTTTNGRPCADAARATLPLSRSIAWAPAASYSRRLVVTSDAMAVPGDQAMRCQTAKTGSNRVVGGILDTV